MRIPMLARFSAYGFLKNQQYYDPFLMLVFWVEKDLSFTVIGFLYGFRELAVQVMEVPSGVEVPNEVAAACVLAKPPWFLPTGR